ncbi:MAG TPA: YceI family protein [Gallionella sp.]|nr:YceI family protein [Gallionella sp.]
MLRLILPVTIAACSSAYAAEECYTADAADGTVTFRAMQRGAPYTGSFLRFAGEACFVKDRLTRIDATLDPSSVDTGLPELDAGLKGVDFFDVREFPSVSFASTSVQPQGNAQLTRGTLEIKGNRREVQVLLHTRRQGDKMSLSGSFTLDRLQYGIGTGDWTNTKWLGAEVQVDIDATLSRKK